MERALCEHVWSSSICPDCNFMCLWLRLMFLCLTMHYWLVWLTRLIIGRHSHRRSASYYIRQYSIGRCVSCVPPMHREYYDGSSLHKDWSRNSSCGSQCWDMLGRCKLWEECVLIHWRGSQTGVSLMCLHACIHVCMRVWMSVCMRVCVCAWVCACVRVCVHVSDTNVHT